MRKGLITSSIITPIVWLGLTATAIVANAADQSVLDQYSKTCIVCHAAGVAGAPKTGDKAAWAPRLAKGLDTLVLSVDKGLNAMPPKGMCFDCSSDQVKALIEYMATGK